MNEIEKLVELLKQRRQVLIEKTVQIKKINDEVELKELYKKAGEYDEKKYCFGDSNPVKYAINKEEGQEDFAIIYEGNVIGFVSIWYFSKVIKHQKCIAIALDKEYRGNSIAKYALNETIKYCFENDINIKAIIVTINIKNQDSKNLIKNTDFRRIPTQKIFMIRNNHFERLNMYGITRKRYERSKNDGK